jgi:hypothetical protein
MLAEAMEKTFEKRKTPITGEPMIFNPPFMKDDTKQAQWLGFITKAKLGDAPTSFESVATDIKAFLQPVVAAIIDRQAFRLFRAAAGRWRT